MSDTKTTGEMLQDLATQMIEAEARGYVPSDTVLRLIMRAIRIAFDELPRAALRNP